MSLFETIPFTLRMMRRFRMSRVAPSKLAVVQEKRFRDLLRHTVAHSRFYRDKFRGIDVERCSLEDLPITTKAEMMERFDDLVTDPEVRRADLERFVADDANVGKLFLGRYPVCHTSGSLGQSLLVVQNFATVELLFGFQMTRGNVGYKLGPLEALRRFFDPGRVAIMINRPGFFPSAWIFQQIPPPLRPYVKMEYFAGSDPELEKKFNAFRPTALVGTPSALDLLALKRDRLAIKHLRQVTTMSETLTDAARGRLEDAFHVPVVDNYSSGECFFLSNGCHAGPGMHVNADWAVLEVVDEEHRRVPDGELGKKALLTNLANNIQPFIRYEVADRIMMAARPCGCGNRLPRIERVEGRSADFFWVKVGDDYRSLLTYPFQHSLEFMHDLREWQAVQAERNRIVVRLEPLPGVDLDLADVRARVEERLRSVGLHEFVELEFEVVPQLQWEWRTGKFRRMVSHVGPPADLAPGLPLGTKRGASEPDAPDAESRSAPLATG